ncbi:uncharacterized protein LOC121736435 isoform X2 [Aricia agestis]|uniref:uncharacterized protein LOC121736435 isoform X2 n=1 Tax=Aricia agestis TaxID=91739 RepID=UPI001C204547|nr:uncharacterized protein LOC121736435 isoform X2 [Aricia agestis]
MMSSSSPHKCKICKKTFSELAGLRQHVQTHSSDNPYACHLCSYAGKTVKYLNRHIKLRHMVADAYECSYCDRKFHYISQLNAHLPVHTNSRPHKCDICGKGFNSYFVLSTHKNIHKAERPYKCSYCEYACNDKSTLRKHHERHTGVQKIYQCEKCLRNFKQKTDLRAHVSEVHLNVDLRTKPCETCGKKFKSTSDLTSHIKVVHEKAYETKCDICGLYISNRYNLKQHLRSHITLRPFICGFQGCDKRYKDKEALTKHSIIHYPDRQYPCGVCGRRFTRPERRRAHETTHRPRARAATCDHCGASFYSKNYLSKHIVTKHLVRARFYCDECGFCAHNKPGLITHIKAGHDTDLTCKICNKVYKKKTILKSHYWNTHFIKYKTKTRVVKPKKPKKPTKPEREVKIKEEPIEQDTSLETLENYRNEITRDADQAAKMKELMMNAVIATSDNLETLFRDLLKPDDEDDDDVKHDYDSPLLCDALLEEEAQKQMKEMLTKSQFAVFYGIKKKTLERVTIDPTRNTYERSVRSSETIPQESNKYISSQISNTSSSIKNDSNVILEAPVRTFEPKSQEAEYKEIGNQISNASSTVENNHRPTVYQKANNAIEKTESATDTIQVDEKDQQHQKEDGKIHFKKETKKVKKVAKKNKSKASKKKRKLKSNKVAKSSAKKTGSVEAVKINCERKEPTVGEKSSENETDGIKLKSNKVSKSSAKKTGSVEAVKINCETKEPTVIEKSSDNETDGIRTRRLVLNKSYADIENSDDETTEDIEHNEGEEESVDQNSEANQSEQSMPPILNSHQCYECFMLFDSKDQLLEHCKEHYNLCNDVVLKKCPLCDFVTNGSLPRHLKLMHNMDLKNTYRPSVKEDETGSRYFYNVDSEAIDKIDIIPSVKNLNKMAYMKLDRRRREENNKAVKKTKLVKKQGEWVVEKFNINIKADNIVIPDLKTIKGDYFEGLKKMATLAKNDGKKFMYPCKGCEKICQTLSALKLHYRHHDPNKKPFKPKVWKHKMKGQKPPEPTKQPEKISEKNIDTKRYEKPKPIVNKHKCDPKLMEFYKNNIRGGDIEFWQFLKIYNRMSKDNVNDFKDLENSTKFGIHIADKTADKPINDIDINSGSIQEPSENSSQATSSMKLATTVEVSRITNMNSKFKRVVMINRKEHLRRIKLKQLLREKMKQNANTKS